MDAIDSEARRPVSVQLVDGSLSTNSHESSANGSEPALNGGGEHGINNRSALSVVPPLFLPAVDLSAHSEREFSVSEDAIMSESALLTPAPPLFQPPPQARQAEHAVTTSAMSAARPTSPAPSGTGSSSRRRSSSSSQAVALPNYPPGMIPDDRRRRNPAYLNSRPRFYELNNDALLGEVWDALHKAQTNWLVAKDIQALLDFCKQMQMGAKAPVRPPSGSIFYFDNRAGEYFRRDGYDYRKKKGSGISVREDHVKLRQGAIYASYVHSAEWIDTMSGSSLFHRRSYWLVDSDEKDRGVVIHYLGNHDSNIEPVTRGHDEACECVLCCLMRENSRPDRPGESLEQILSRIDGAGTAKLKKQAKTATSSMPKIRKMGKKQLQQQLQQQQQQQYPRKKTLSIDEDDPAQHGDSDSFSGQSDVSSLSADSRSRHSMMMVEGSSTNGANNNGNGSGLDVRMRDVPRRAAAPSQPMIDGSSSDEDSDEEAKETRKKHSQGGGGAKGSTRAGGTMLMNGGRLAAPQHAPSSSSYHSQHENGLSVSTQHSEEQSYMGGTSNAMGQSGNNFEWGSMSDYSLAQVKREEDDAFDLLVSPDGDLGPLDLMTPVQSRRTSRMDPMGGDFDDDPLFAPSMVDLEMTHGRSGMPVSLSTSNLPWGTPLISPFNNNNNTIIQPTPSSLPDSGPLVAPTTMDATTVSYTHLTLPTICSV